MILLKRKVFEDAQFLNLAIMAQHAIFAVSPDYNTFRNVADQIAVLDEQSLHKILEGFANSLEKDRSKRIKYAKLCLDTIDYYKFSFLPRITKSFGEFESVPIGSQIEKEVMAVFAQFENYLYESPKELYVSSMQSESLLMPSLVEVFRFYGVRVEKRNPFEVRNR